MIDPKHRMPSASGCHILSSRISRRVNKFEMHTFADDKWLDRLQGRMVRILFCDLFDFCKMIVHPSLKFYALPNMKEGNNGFNPWADKEKNKKTDPRIFIRGCSSTDRNPFIPFLLAETPIIKEGMNGFYPWADKEKNKETDLRIFIRGCSSTDSACG